MTLKIQVCGFLYLLILVLQIAMAVYGYILDPTPKHYDADEYLPKISNKPKKFKISMVLALIEHGCVITLAIMLFVAFGAYSLILGVVWTVFRVAEGSIQVYIEKDYWRLLDLARQYAGASGEEKNALSDSYRSILQTKSSRFGYTMICWSIGTLALSIVLVTFIIVPLFIGCIGIASSIAVGIINVIKVVKPNFEAYETLSSIGGLAAIVFELLIGIWLLFLI